MTTIVIITIAIIIVGTIIVLIRYIHDRKQVIENIQEIYQTDARRQDKECAINKAKADTADIECLKAEQELKQLRFLHQQLWHAFRALEKSCRRLSSSLPPTPPAGNSPHFDSHIFPLGKGATFNRYAKPTEAQENCYHVYEVETEPNVFKRGVVCVNCGYDKRPLTMYDTAASEALDKVMEEETKAIREAWACISELPLASEARCSPCPPSPDLAHPTGTPADSTATTATPASTTKPGEPT